MQSPYMKQRKKKCINSECVAVKVRNNSVSGNERQLNYRTHDRSDDWAPLPGGAAAKGGHR